MICDVSDGRAPDSPCFTTGTMIATATGQRPIEALQRGDRVVTRDNGLQVIRWIGRRTLSAWDLARAPHLRPVRVRAGALGDGLPERDMLLSPNHRLLFVEDCPEGEREVFVAAGSLVGEPGIERAEDGAIDYIHILCDRHEVLLSDGTWTESFQPGDHTLAALGADQKRELLEIFPELGKAAGVTAFAAARRTTHRPGAMHVIEG